MINIKNSNQKVLTSRYPALILLIIILSNLLFNSFHILKISSWTLRPIDIIAILMLLILPVLYGNKNLTKFQPMSGFLFSFFIIATGSTVLTIFLSDLSIDEVSRVMRALIRLGEVTILALVIRIIIRRDILYPILWFVIIICLAYPIYSIYLNNIEPGVYSRIGSFISVGTAEEGILGGGQASFNEIAALCATVFLVTCSLSLTRSIPFRHRACSFTLATLYLLGLFLTGSRSGIVSTLAGILVLSLLVNRRQKIILGIIGLIFAAILTIQQDYIVVMYDRLLATFNPSSFEYATTMIRFDAWRSALQTFFEHPIIGVGYACFPLYNPEGFITTENYFLEILADTGLLGLFAWLWYGRRLIKRIFHHPRKVGNKKELWRQVILPATVVLLVSNLTGNNFFDPGLLLLFFLLCIVLEKYGQEIICIRRTPMNNVLKQSLS